MKEFKCLDAVLLASGCQLYRRGCCAHFVNAFMIFLLIICYSGTIVDSITLSQVNGGLTILMYMERYSSEVSGIVFIIVMNVNRKRMVNLTETMTMSLTDAQRNSLSRHALLSLLLIVLKMIQEIVFMRHHLQKEERTLTHQVTQQYTRTNLTQ